jgi:hypothetical protein
MSTIAAGTLLTNSLVQTGDTTGNLVIQTNGNTTAATFDTSQNLTVVGAATAPSVVASNGIFVNANTVSTNYTVAAGYNGVSAGPVTVNSGITVTVSAGSVWTVV